MVDLLARGERKVYLEAKDFGLREGERFSVYFDETFSGLYQWLSAGLSALCYQASEGYLAMCDSGS